MSSAFVIVENMIKLTNVQQQRKETKTDREIK